MAARRRPAAKTAAPKSSQKQQQPAVQSRDPARRKRILDVAKRHFVRNGFKGTNLDAVARDAGCAKGALYLEFPDKRTLIVEVIYRAYREIAERFHTHVAAIESPLERIIASLRFSYEETAREPLFERLLHEDPDMKELMPPQFLDEVQTQLKMFNAWVAEAKERGELRAGVDTDALPFVMTPLKYAPMHLAVIEELRLFSKSRALEAILDILRAGLAAPASPASSGRTR